MFKVLKDSCIILYKFENLNEMNNVLENCNLPKLTPVEREILNRTRVIEGIQKEVKRVPLQKRTMLDSFTGKLKLNFNYSRA